MEQTDENKTEEIPQEDLDWLKSEMEDLEKQSTFEGERLPSLELPENKNTSFKVDASKKFEQWIDPKDNTVKKIIPVSQNGNRFVLWINTRNPVYRQIVEKLSKGQTEFTIFRTGTKQNTRYTIVEE